MTWLTRVVIPQEETIKRRLFDCYAWHKFSWECFPGCPEAQRDFLIRLDYLPSDSAMRLYIVSQREALRPRGIKDSWWAVKEIPVHYLEHARYRFSLRANPTKSRTIGEGNRKIRRALLNREDQLNWLQGKAIQSGFEFSFSSIQITKVGDYRCTIRGHSALSIGFDFNGVLTVTNQEKFKHAFNTGIGKSKAFGFGMLLVFPL